MAATTATSLILLLLAPLIAAAPSPYLSPTTLLQNYQNMLATFKIYIYTPSQPFNFPPNTPSSLFYTSLLHSPFLTENPNEAHLFFVPFSPDTSTRALARVVRELRNDHPYWNQTLGADHFFVSPNGIDYSSDRNALELKKNSVQISVFPVTSGYFVPHKDITLPPFNQFSKSPTIVEKHTTTTSFLGYLNWDGKTESELVNEMKGFDEFLIEEMKSEPLDYINGRRSKFCLFLYRGDVAGMVQAMSSGCVPVVIVDRPIQDLPLMDVLRWSDLVLLVRGGGAWRVREVLSGVSEEKYLVMREMGVAASKHLVWSAEGESQPLDAFHMVMYQLWLRRHAVRYARRDFA